MCKFILLIDLHNSCKVPFKCNGSLKSILSEKKKLTLIHCPNILGEWARFISIIQDYYWMVNVPRRYFFCGSFMFLFCLVFAMSFCESVYMCLVVTCWERADLLALVCGVYCEFVTFPLVSWVRCGTWLCRFLIFAPLLTLMPTWLSKTA